jgi:short subunit dehydrogenase-like uncharacterized protein
MASSDPDLSVVVFGVTGITGRGVAAHLAERARTNGFSWAAAGRSAERIASVLGELGVEAPETIEADVADPASLREMAQRARVVLDLVGPYTLYGRPVIEACIAGGAHYADLTGEIPFVREMIDEAGEQARTAGVKVVNVSGFEALPADLAVALASATARERWSEELATADLDVEMFTPDGAVKPSEAISGGTLQSIAEIVGHERAAEISDPAALIEDEDLAQRVRNVSPIAIAPRIGPEGEVIGPMAPAAYINPAVIHRTAALAAAEEGRQFNPFRYREGIAIPGGAASLPLRYGLAAALTGSQALTKSLSKASQPVRGRVAGFLRRRLPGSGFGPQGERMTEFSWRLGVNARTVGGHYVRVDLDADGHPGYLSTAKMLGEAGILLAEDGATPERSGFLTPAAALGTECAAQFRHAGLRFQVSS